MSSRSDQYDAESHTDDQGGGWLTYYPQWRRGWGVWPFTSGREEDEARYEENAYEDTGDSFSDEDSDGSLWDEGLITLLLVAGVLMFVFPEPITSGVGILLISIGVVAWLVDWAV